MSDPRNNETEGIGRVMPGIREECDGMRRDTVKDLNCDQREIQSGRKSESGPEAFRRVAVAYQAMMVVVMVVVIVRHCLLTAALLFVIPLAPRLAGASQPAIGGSR